MSGLSGQVFSARHGRVLKTGQTTQYNSELDDGHYEKGRAKAYDILTTGQYSGTSNVDLIHLTAATISFDAATKEIRDSGNAMAMFKTSETLVVTGSTDNNGTFTVATGNVAAKAVVNEALTDEAAGATVSIAKREAISNNCVLDKNTGLMWLRYSTAKMGTGGNGKMPRTGQLYDIFQYCAAIIAASLGGYTDWRVPNRNELESIIALNVFKRDSTAFPSFGFPQWTSSGVSDTYSWYLDDNLVMTRIQDTTLCFVTLVRG